MHVCRFLKGAGGIGGVHRGRRHQFRVHCRQSAAKSSARLQGRAQLSDCEPPITFTEGGLEGFSCGLPGCLSMDFPSLEVSVCAVRDRERGREKQTEMNGLAHHHNHDDPL